MRKYLLAALLLLPGIASAQFNFVNGQVLTAAQLNSAFSAVLPLTGGTLTGPLTVPSFTVSQSSGSVNVSDTSGTGHSDVYLENNGVHAWSLRNYSTGNGFDLTRYVGGAVTDSPISVANSSGVVTMADGLELPGNTQALAMSAAITGTGVPENMPLYISNSYDGTITSGYQTALADIHHTINYGYNNTAATGSVGFSGGVINVANAANPSGGRSEFTPWSSAVVPVIGGNITGGQNWYMDDIVMTNTNTSSAYQEGFLAGHQIAVQKWVPGNAIDANHSGSWGTVITTDPQNLGYDTQNRAAYSTYPLDAMLLLSGWSGPNSVMGGASAGATPAAAVGLQVGGPVGSTWAPYSSRSYIPLGIDIQDYTTAGIQIEQPHSGSSGVAINVVSGAGIASIADGIATAGTLSVSGLSTLTGGVTSGASVIAAFSNAGMFVNDTSGTNTSRYAFQNNGTVAWALVNSTGTAALTLNRYVSGILQDAPYGVSNSTGVFTLADGLQLPLSTVAALPTCTSSLARVMRAVSDATIPTYNGALTGGGTVEVPVFCNGTAWSSH